MKKYGVEGREKRRSKGITLMALVITVIVLLILSGIGVAMLSGDNGIINRSVNAKDSAAVKSEIRIVEVSSNSARGKNKYGLVEEEKLKNELKITAGEGKTEVTPYDNGSHFLITFLDTNRVYEVDNEEGVRYLGALNDVVNTGILTANPKRDKTPTKEDRIITISLKTINEIPDEDVEVYYTWVKKKTQEIETSDLKLIEEFKGDTNDRTIKSGTVSTEELEDEGKWYLYVEARIKDGETVIEYFGDYVVGEPVIVADMGFVRYNYEKNGGTGCNRLSDQVEYGTTVALKGTGSNTATRSGGWDFVGWTTDEYGTIPMDSVEVNEQSNYIVVYAIFKKDVILKFYDATHGTDPVEKTTALYNKNTTGILSSSNVPSIGAYNGWTAGYWTDSTNPNGKNVTDDSGNIVASGATNYYAVYTKNITVEYNLNGGTGTSITSATGTAKVNSSNLNVIEGASINLPESDVTKSGYIFNGWNTKADGTGIHYDKNAVGKFNEGITLYAEWKTKQTVNPPTGLEVGTDGKVTWTASSNATGYEISIDNNTWTSATSGVNYLSTITAATGSRTVYVRAVNSDTTNYNTPSTNVSKTVTVYSVTLTKGTGISAVTGAGNYISGATVTLGATVMIGHTWSQWTQTSGGTQISTTKGYSAAISSNWAYTANATASVYTITLDKSSGTGGTSSIYVTYGNKYTLTNNGNAMTTSENPITIPTRSGYEFQGYYTESNGAGTQYISKTGYLTSSASTTYFSTAGTLYAYWTRPIYEIALNNQGATTAGTEKIYLTYSIKYSITQDGNAMTTSANPITIPTKTGYVFKGYFTTAETGGTQYISSRGYILSSASLTGFTANGNLYARWEKVTLKKSETSPTDSTAKFLYTTIERRKIKKITFAESISGHTVDGTTCFDVSSIANAGQVLLWITSTDSNGYVEIVIGQDGGVKANPDSSYLFYRVGYTPSTFTIDFTNFNTSGVTDMQYMFFECGYTGMTSLNLGNNFDTSSVTNMYAMFDYCGYTAMTSLNLGSSFNPDNVTNMIRMFNGCGYTAMTSLDLGNNFKPSNATDMTYMFQDCGYKAMTSLNLGSNFSPSKVTNMNGMFYRCGHTAMTSLDLGDNFDTSNVTDMQSMFGECGYEAMVSLDLGDKFDTSNVTNMSGMFDTCGRKAMTSLDLGDKFDTSNVTSMGSMFMRCGYTAMTSLDLGDKFDTSSVTSMGSMFLECGYKAMTSLDLGDKFDTSNVTNMSSMFDRCGYTAMTSLDLGENFDTSSVTYMYQMFASCGFTAMTSLDLGDKFDTSNVQNMEMMFYRCGYTAMTSLDLGDKFDTSSVVNIKQMFNECGSKAMTSLDLGDKFDTSGVTNMHWMFFQCGQTAMTSLDLGDKFDTSSVTNMERMFDCCGQLAMTSLNLGDKFDTSSVTNMERMFYCCGQNELTSIDLGNKFDTSNVTDMQDMFYSFGQKKMSSLDLGDKFDTSKVTNMDYMFYNCKNLVRIYVKSGFDTTNVTSGSSMFKNDEKLVGGMGTVYDINNVNYTYAHIDGGTINPGYFTDKNTYFIEFDANGGTGTMSNQIMSYGTASNLTPNAFTKTGHTFAGWNTEADGSGTSYTEGQSVLNLEDGMAKTKKLYAQWQIVTLRTSETSTSGTTAKFLYTTIERRKIKSISFANSISGHTVDGTTCFDVSSVANSGQVLLWITNTDENGYYDIVIGQNGGVKANPDSSNLFSCVGYNTPLILNLTNFDTSNVTNMYRMFSQCGYYNLQSINLGNMDTSNAENMSYMFSSLGGQSTAMTSLNLGSNFDTSSATNMESMFSYCGDKGMTSLSLGSKFDTSNVTNMKGMFGGCGYTAMTSLDLGDKFDTSKVTTMLGMFSGCGYKALTSLDLGNKFDTSKVELMSTMFQTCGYTAMTSLDLGDKFDTSRVQNMTGMFYSCGYKAMTSLDLGDKFDTSSVTNMSNMFYNCGYTAMTSLNLGSNFNTSNVTNMNSMFGYCGYTAMTSLDLGDKFDTSSVTNMSNMFSSCGKTLMTSLDLGDKFDTSSVQNMSYMFASCGYTAMTSLDLGDNFDTSKVTNMAAMFAQCGYTAMTSLDLGDKFDTSSVTNMSNMFSSCGKTLMTSLDLGDNFDTSSVTNMSYMFNYCGREAMTSLDLGDRFDTSNVTNMSSMFSYCGYTAMTSLDLGDKFDTSNVTNMSSMFGSCGREAMTSLDLGDKFDTSSVTNMSSMFNDCPNLVTIYATSSFVTTNVISSSYMFNGDIKLVGGMGTTYSSSHIDHAYAHIDGGTANPGYFTDREGIYIDNKGNEFMWIDVPNDGTGPIYPANATDAQIEAALRNYVSDVIPTGTSSDSRLTTTAGYTDTWYNGCGLTESEYNAKKSTMLNSIKDNGGFYIGKYETGYFGNTIRTSGGNTTQTAVIKPDAYPYNYVTCSEAEDLAEGFATDGKTASLLFGIQWDLVLKYINVKGAKTVAQLTQDSTSWGNYANNDNVYGTFTITSAYAKKSVDCGDTWSSIAKNTVKTGIFMLTTGSSMDLASLKIYDLAGNLYERTLEKSSDNSTPCSSRGGVNDNNGNILPASHRANSDLNGAYFDTTFRVTLY